MAEQLGKLQACGSIQGYLRCTWTIEQFSSLDSEVGTYHLSKAFKLQKEGLEWYLKLYPGGESEFSEGYVSCFIRVRNAIQSMKVNLRLYLRNTHSDVLFSAEFDGWRTVTLTNGYGYPRTRKRSELMSMLVDDTLVITVEVSHSTTCFKDNAEIHRCVEVTPMLKVVDDFRNLWESKECTDTVISVGGDTIPVHSIVLGARSKVFEDMFRQGTIEVDGTRLVEVTDFEKKTMESLMEFIYSGNVRQMDLDLALELLRASQVYEVSDLKSYCSGYLIPFLNNDNVCLVLLSADMYNAEELRTQAMKYIYENLSEKNFASQRSIFKTRPELVCDIIQAMIKYKKIEQLKFDGQENSSRKRRRD